MHCVIVVLVLLATSAAAGQRVAIIAPAAGNDDYSNALSAGLTSEGLKLVDRSLAASAVDSRAAPEPFNLTTTSAKSLAAAIGCDYFVLYRSDVVRRASFSRPDYFEAFAVIYVVSGRTGHLTDWRLVSHEGPTSVEASIRLVRSAPDSAKDIAEHIRTSLRSERNAAADPPIEEVPDPDAPAAQGLRAPVPYRRIKPEYTKLAGFYNVRATVDVLVDISDSGEVRKIDVVRWAGFGLDESVAAAVKKMNWRPAMRNGRPLAMRVLLRYNFTKVEDDQ